MNNPGSLLRNSFAAAMLCAVAGLAAAAPVAYSEAVSGDLSFGSPLTIFTFDVGVNTISGNTGAPTPIDFDSFAFIVPVGMVLVAGQVQLTDTSGNLLESQWSVRAGSLNANSGTLVQDLIAASPGIATLGQTLGAGDYNVSAAGLAINGDRGYGDYQFTFTLRALNTVPEPDTLALLGVAGLGLLAARRRPRSALPLG